MAVPGCCSKTCIYSLGVNTCTCISILYFHSRIRRPSLLCTKPYLRLTYLLLQRRLCQKTRITGSENTVSRQSNMKTLIRIRDIPDHATFRGKGVNAGWLDKLVVFSLRPYIIRATLTISSVQSMYSKQNMKTEKKSIECCYSYDVNHQTMQMFLVFQKYI